MTDIWTPESRFSIWFEIEAHATDALAELGVVPKEAARAIWEKGAFEVERIDAIEAEVKHDVIAFLTNVAEHVGEPARFMHQGMTSSDVLDTALAVQLARASDILLDDLDKLVVEYSIAVTNNWNKTRDEIFGQLREHFSESQIMELTWRIALCGAFNRFNDILQLDIEDGVPAREAAE